MDELRAGQLADDVTRAWVVRKAVAGARPLLGVVMLDRHHDSEDLEVSNLFLPAHWGRGYAKAPVQQGMKHAFDELGPRHVVAETRRSPTASIRLLQDLGFSLPGPVIRFGAEQSICAADHPAPAEERSESVDSPFAPGPLGF